MADTAKKKAPAKPRKTAAKKTEETVENAPVAAQGTETAVAAKPKKASSGNGAAAESASEKKVSPEEVARLAHHFYTERGHQHGRHEDDWYRAEQELRKRAS